MSPRKQRAKNWLTNLMIPVSLGIALSSVAQAAELTLLKSDSPERTLFRVCGSELNNREKVYFRIGDENSGNSPVKKYVKQIDGKSCAEVDYKNTTLAKDKIYVSTTSEGNGNIFVYDPEKKGGDEIQPPKTVVFQEGWIEKSEDGFYDMIICDSRMQESKLVEIRFGNMESIPTKKVVRAGEGKKCAVYSRVDENKVESEEYFYINYDDENVSLAGVLRQDKPIAKEKPKQPKPPKKPIEDGGGDSPEYCMYDYRALDSSKTLFDVGVSCTTQQRVTLTVVSKANNQETVLCIADTYIGSNMTYTNCRFQLDRSYTQDLEIKISALKFQKIYSDVERFYKGPTNYYPVEITDLQLPSSRVTREKKWFGRGYVWNAQLSVTVADRDIENKYNTQNIAVALINADTNEVVSTTTTYSNDTIRFNLWGQFLTWGRDKWDYYGTLQKGSNRFYIRVYDAYNGYSLGRYVDTKIFTVYLNDSESLYNE